MHVLHNRGRDSKVATATIKNRHLHVRHWRLLCRQQCAETLGSLSPTRTIDDTEFCRVHSIA